MIVVKDANFIFIKNTKVRRPTLEKKINQGSQSPHEEFNRHDWVKKPARNSVLNISNIKSSICYDLLQTFGFFRRFSHPSPFFMELHRFSRDRRNISKNCPWAAVNISANFRNMSNQWKFMLEIKCLYGNSSFAGASKAASPPAGPSSRQSFCTPPPAGPSPRKVFRPRPGGSFASTNFLVTAPAGVQPRKIF